ncbi:MAG: adenylate/guanylate cyclase domain-containing protein [Verrucomicrobia bacterium]|nr:adenylate/guanylate cyclase domain-containing protein [Verrucomicrobiota bacterium]
MLFCDIVGFTSYCDRSMPEQVVTDLQRLVESYETLTSRYNIEKIKTIGGSFMATAGLLTPSDNPVMNCVLAGLEMVSTVRQTRA